MLPLKVVGVDIFKLEHVNVNYLLTLRAVPLDWSVLNYSFIYAGTEEHGVLSDGSTLSREYMYVSIHPSMISPLKLPNNTLLHQWLIRPRIPVLHRRLCQNVCRIKPTRSPAHPT